MKFNKFGSDFVMVLKNISLNNNFVVRLLYYGNFTLLHLPPRAIWLNYTLCDSQITAEGRYPTMVLYFTYMFDLIF